MKSNRISHRPLMLLGLVLLTAASVVGVIAVVAPANAATTPNDPLYSSQWNLTEINAPKAWDVTTGSPLVKVAIIDTGVSPQPELEGQLGTGYNAISPGASTADDYSTFGSGSGAAGIVAARANNGRDMAGISWSVTILPVKVCGSNGACNPVHVAAGIDWAVDNGAHIIHITPPTRDFATAQVNASIARAIGRDILVVSSAGTAAQGILYPANLPGVIAVSGYRTDRSAAWGGGPELDIVAPGESIYTLTRSGCCWGLHGPQYAAAQVTGTLALLLAAGVPAASADEALLNGTINLGPPGWDPTFGRGRLDMCKALNMGGVSCGSGAPAPTSTATRTATSTPPPATSTSTPTPLPPTATRTFTPIPATATLTPTPLPPTPTRTSTPVPPTSTPDPCAP
jgi:Subtilase family